MSTEKTAGLAATIERRIALAILRGERVAGSRLPPVRTLAADFSASPPTIQRVIDRLETAGLVSARRGSGVVVNAPEHLRDLALLPLWFEAFKDDPDRASAILSDFLELRRVLTGHVVRTRRDKLVRAGPQVIALAAKIVPGMPPADVERIDLAMTSAMIRAAEQFAVTAIFRATERLVLEVPTVAEALYGELRHYLAMINAVGLALSRGLTADALAGEVEKALAAWDRLTVAKFHKLVASGRAEVA